MFDEVGRAAMGAWGSRLVYGTIYLSILCVPVILHLTCMETLRQVRPLPLLRMRALREWGSWVYCGVNPVRLPQMLATNRN